MPAALGWHPWFRRHLAQSRDGTPTTSAEVELVVDALAMFERGADGLPTGARQLAEIAFDVPWSTTDRLPFLAVSTVAYCGLANTVYREQGEPAIASPSP